MAGLISEQMARRLAAVLKWAEARMITDARAQGIRTRRGRGDHGMRRMKLLAALEYRDSANAVITYQDADGVWTDGSDDEDEELVYDALLTSGKQLPSGAYVYCCRDHRSGLLNVVSSDSCSENIPA